MILLQTNSFFDELTKIAGELQGYMRSGRRPISIDKLLENEKTDKTTPSEIFSLDKTSEINLSGLSPETIINSPQPQPMETPGYQKAMEALNRSKTQKLANVYEEGKEGLKHLLAGAGGARALAELAGGVKEHLLKKGPMSDKHKIQASLLGAGLGGAEYVRKKITKKPMEKKESIYKYSNLLGSSPFVQLKATKQVGTFKNILQKK